jgi:DUF4097 and DUF4098 domain-containing protein YvlB
MNKKKFYTVVAFLVITVLVAGSSVFAQDLQVIHDKNFKTSPGKALKISGSSGDVLVTSWDRSEVQVKILGNEKAKDKVEFKFNQNSDMIEVIAKREGSFLFNSGIKIRYEVKVPQNFNNSIHTGGGDIRFAGVEGDNILKTSGGDISIKEVKGKLEVSTSGGDIDFERISGNIEMSTSGGDIKGGGFSGDLRVSTSGGDIKLEGSNSKVTAKTSGGDIGLIYNGENKGIELATSGGDINITVPGNFNASALLNSSGGDVECKIKTTDVKKLSSSKFEGNLNQGGSKLVAKTSGGDITVKTK